MGELNPVESRTVQIIGGTVRSRLIFKREMEKFGRVEVVYMGNRHDPTSQDAPMVRFATVTSAQTALAAINAGQVFNEGGPAKAVFKQGGGTRQPEKRYDERGQGGQRGLDVTSRDIARDLARDERAKQREERQREERQRDDRYDRNDWYDRGDRGDRGD